MDTDSVSEEDMTRDESHILFLKEINPCVHIVKVWNKCDKNSMIKIGCQKNCELDRATAEGRHIYPVSAKEGIGIDTLAETIYSKLSALMPQPEELTPNLRQANLLEQAKNELEEFWLNANILPPDALAFHLEQTVTILAGITGEIVTEDIVNAIFENFCVGK